MLRFLRRFTGLHWLLLALTLGLFGFGVLAIESAARHLPGGGALFAGKQLIFGVLGLVAMGGLSLVDYRWIRRGAWPLYGISIILLVVVTFFGESVGGSKSAFTVGPLRFQPSQLAIASGILLIPVLLEYLRKRSDWWSHPLTQMGAIIAICSIPLALVIVQGDMGSALVWLPLALVTMLIAGIPLRYLSLGLLLGALMAPWLYFFVLPKVSSRGAERIELYVDLILNREIDIHGDGHAPHYVTMAIGKSGMNGVGWHAEERSLHAKRFIPWKTAHNDYIFAIIGEEQGFRGAMLLVLGFTALFLGILHVANMSRDFMGRMVCAGVLALLFAHFFENIGMCIRLTPITGIPLPLISYGGTFLVICFALLGIVQSVWTGREESAG